MDSFTAALARLDPANRALLDLSLRRGMRPDDIADTLGLDSRSVVAAREQALDSLAVELGVSDRDVLRARLAELPAEAWTPQTAGAEERPRRKSRLPLLLTLLAVVVVAALVVALASGGDEETTAQRTPTTTTPTTATDTTRTSTQPKPAPSGTETEPGVPQPRPTRLSAIAGGRGRATAVLAQDGRRLVLRARGLAPGGYQVWLYNSVLDARSLGAARGSALNLDLHLPRNASKYRAIDVSREPRDGNPNHSGESVLRVTLAKLAGG